MIANIRVCIRTDPSPLQDGRTLVQLESFLKDAVSSRLTHHHHSGPIEPKNVRVEIAPLGTHGVMPEDLHVQIEISRAEVRFGFDTKFLRELVEEVSDAIRSDLLVKPEARMLISAQLIIVASVES